LTKMFKHGVKKSKRMYNFVFSFFDPICLLSRPRKLLSINVNMNDVEKQKKLMLNENVFVKLKKLMLRHSKKKTNDEHENNTLVLQVVLSFQVYLLDFYLFHVSYIYFI
jgi:phosphoribosylamine-glycine ligase